MLKRIDRILRRVSSLPPAVRFYTTVLGMRVIQEDSRIASLAFPDDRAELILHVDPDLPADAVYFLVDDVRALYRRRDELHLHFAAPPSPAARGYRATIHDPFGNVLLVLDRTAHQHAAPVEDAKPPGSLFAGVQPRLPLNADALLAAYRRIGRTADDLPYTPHFEAIYAAYASAFPQQSLSRAETWRHLLNLRKAGKLPKLGDARSPAPQVLPDDRKRLLEMLGPEIGKRDRLPYSRRFESLVDEFNKIQQRPLSPHLVWRLVATLAK